MRNPSALKSLLAAAALFVSPVGAQASIFTFTASLSGLNESPPVATPGSGFASVTVDTFAHTMSVSATFQDLIGTTTSAFIHCCLVPPLTTVVPATQLPFFTGFPIGVTSGTYNHVFDLTDPASWNVTFLIANGGLTALAEVALLAGMSNGNAYFNIHTSFRPGGEIRGTLEETVVPVPGALPLFATGLGALGLYGWRRKRRSQPA